MLHPEICNPLDCRFELGAFFLKDRCGQFPKVTTQNVWNKSKPAIQWRPGTKTADGSIHSR